MSVNKVIILGRLGRDPELRYSTAGQGVATLSLATDETWKDRQGTSHDRTEWHRVTVWGKMAEACRQHLRKGQEVFIEGRIQTRKWQDQHQKTRYSTEIVATLVRFIGSQSPLDRLAESSPLMMDSASPLPALDTSAQPVVDELPF